MIKRNYLIRKAKKSQMMMDYFFPILFCLYALISLSNNKVEINDYGKIGATPLNELKSLQLNTDLVNNVTLGFVLPEKNQDETIIKKVMDYNEFSSFQINPIHFKNQKEMDDYNNYNYNLLAGIIFESDDYLHYTIRINSTSVPNPESDPQINYVLGRNQAENSIIESDKYLDLFAPIQAAIDQAIIRLKTNDDTFNLVHYFGKLGKPASKYSSPKSFTGNIIAYDISAMFILSVITIVMYLVKEKEDKIKEGLLMSGVHPTIFWLSWLAIYVSVVFLTSLIGTLILMKAIKLNPIILFITIFLYGISCCNFGFLVSTFFTKVKTASSVASIIVLVFISVNFLISYINVTIRIVISFFISTISLGSFINEIYVMQNKNEVISFNAIIKSNAGIFLLGLIVTIFLYFILAVIYDNKSSGDNKYLFKKNIKISDFHDENEITYEKDIQEDFNAKRNEKCIVEVSNVHKVFKRKNSINDSEIKEKNIKKDEFLAVNDVSFKVYQNEIFAILGHNGAGKTTLINIMIGILKASCGDVYFDGKSVSSSINEIRRNLGVCAQINIIHDELTVADHIRFYAAMKNTTVDVDEVLKEIDLIQQKESKASKLSGGQKRKLCIGMALIGNPKYIFLDEPTTGLDPLSRRKIWELLIKHRQGKVIFLTTHYMDEADILADRKLILNKGKIRCLGTSLYLKNHFNMSYNLDIETNHKDNIDQLIKNYLPEATYYINQNEVNDDVISNKIKCHTWKLPLNSTSNFSSLLNELENQKNNGIIKKYALNMPTLEELFIRLEDNDIEEETNTLNIKNDINDEEDKHHLIQFETELPKLRSVAKPTRISHIICLTKYRLKIFLKDKAFAINSVITPVIVAAFTFFFISWLINRSNTSTNQKMISIPDMYSNTIINYDSNSNLTTNFSKDTMSQYLSKNNILKSIPLNEIQDPQYNDNYYISSISGLKIENNNVFQIHYNDTMTHSIPAIINAISNTILASNNVKGQIEISTKPFETKNNALTIVALSMAGILIGMSFITVLSKFGPLIVHERVNQLLQQLQLNGVSRVNYWISCFLADNTIFLSTCILIIIAGIIVKFEPLLDIKILIIIFICLIIWSIPTLLVQYIFSFLFNKEETAVNYIVAINTYSVMIEFLIFSSIDAKSTNKLEMIINNNCLFGYPSIIINIIFTVLTPGYGIISILNSLYSMKLYGKLLSFELSLANILNIRNGISPILVTLVVLIFVYFFLLICFDKKKNQTNKKDIKELPPKIKANYEEILQNGDSDINHEFEFVKAHQKELPISVLHLSKEFKVSPPNDKEKREEYRKINGENFTYGQIHSSMFNSNFVKTAVIDVNFGVRNHECFGLLGPNGAGKSTTLNTITCTIPQTTGSICFNGVETHLARLDEISLGYCPQKDILWKELTLREHIELFLGIRGYTSEECKKYATQYINIAGLEEHQNKRTENLSGGTKRKLSLLIAICGYPKQILLDEPTAGMDPSTRRLIWNIIQKTKNMNDSALILTTHSMEEAENLCDRLAILVNGRLMCIGSPEHLKMKYGDSYILELQSENIDKFHSEVIEKGKLFGNKEYSEERSSENRIKYVVKMTDNIGYIFDVMEHYKSKGLIIDYSFSQTSLEQIFINFAKKQIIDENNP
ncbi:P-loop containing nucleoside triphosphate hydrolase protein [Anaeromyces robustus]|uniref:p-loop containing nucleoside triphosphate hydrolase protein n=1 Tax=Anaeromyces robustus TaxID=1754192 RepID=A0A1Y1XR40_9FUNG|nr:P-loop containing nucleoside triphosphate hydrolase protein [Anaeromyces robustus]|eukprot:ORX87956.1 P-loop containing nucleoside triphosphate hydrolase protein [Anaeromyces robustus]